MIDMPKAPEHLQPTMSPRGFARMPAIESAVSGEVQVYESSAASGPHLWMEVLDSGREATVHLPAAAAWRVGEQLGQLLDDEKTPPRVPIAGARGDGGEVSMWQSSAFGQRMVHVRVDDGIDAVVVELAPKAAGKLREQIVTLLANHYQGDARPEKGSGR